MLSLAYVAITILAIADEHTRSKGKKLWDVFSERGVFFALFLGVCDGVLGVVGWVRVVIGLGKRPLSGAYAVPFWKKMEKDQFETLREACFVNFKHKLFTS